MFFLLYKHPDNGDFEDFPKIFDHFSTISENSRKLSEDHTNIAKHFQEPPRMLENFRKLPKTFEEDQKMSRSYTNELMEIYSHKE